jgi:hypothetical protein
VEFHLLLSTEVIIITIIIMDLQSLIGPWPLFNFLILYAISKTPWTGETVAVYCENHTEYTDPVRTSQETHYVFTTKPNRLMLFRETVAVYCENHTEHTDQFVPHRKHITSPLQSPTG